MVFNGNEDLDFEAAWDAEPARRKGQPVRADEPSKLFYSEICRLGAQVQRLFTHTRKVHFVRLEDMKADPGTVYDGVLDFLSLPRVSVPLTAENMAKGRRYPALHHAGRAIGKAKAALGIRGGFGLLQRVSRWNRKPEAWQTDSRMAAYLEGFFRDDQALLSELTK
jgi:hypothetical protein